CDSTCGVSGCGHTNCWSRVAMLAPKRMSDLIGMIYDCAIEPDRWPHTIAEICGTMGCLSGMILLVDLRRSQHRFAYTWGLAANWERRFLGYSDTLSDFYARAFSKANASTANRSSCLPSFRERAPARSMPT